VFRIQIGGMTGRRAAPGTVRTSHVLGNASEARRPRWLAQVLCRVMGANSRWSCHAAGVSSCARAAP
jgi:hypothetical protein